jgi:hypothetical protein
VDKSFIAPFEGLGACIVGLVMVFGSAYCGLTFGFMLFIVGCGLMVVGLFDVCNTVGLINFYKRLRKNRKVDLLNG